MSRRIVIFFFIVALLLAASFLFYLNPDQVILNYGGKAPIKAPMAMVLISAFLFGGFIVGLVAVFLGIKHQLELWRLERKRKQEQALGKLLTAVREQHALGNHLQAAQMAEKIVAQDPEFEAAWLELSSIVKTMSGDTEALRILERARLKLRSSVPILLRAAEIYEQAGNYIGAYDNLRIVLERFPTNRGALMRIIHAAEALRKIPEAINFQKTLIKQLSGIDYVNGLRHLNQLELLAIKAKHNWQFPDQPSAGLIEDLKAFSQRVRDLDLAWAEYGLAEEARGSDPNQISKLYAKAFHHSENIKHLAAIVRLWLKAHDPSKGINAVKTLIAGMRNTKTEAQIFLANVLANFGMTDEAVKMAEEIIVPANDPSQEQTLGLLKARLALKLGSTDATTRFSEYLKLNPASIPGDEIFSREKAFTTPLIQATDAPAPSLSVS
ncbi:DUF1049 domain-containing protein [bacterium]|nr:DUF1049 domain-containing protein [bacterium]